MTPENIALASTLVSKSYVEQGAQALTRRRRLLTSLLSERRLPAEGWDAASIELLLHEASLMDSNNFIDNVGVGEREARVACPLVARRHYGLAHGIGRSGDISAEQPKAAGSTLLARLCNLVTVDALRAAGLVEAAEATVLPLATGMALTLTLLALVKQRPAGARFVVWPRCDQKTCVKAVLAAGLELVVVPNTLEGDQLRASVDAVRAAVNAVGADAVVCVMTTSSCFAPRGADRLVDIARLCAELGCGHVINNAYGVQSAALCAAVTAACRRGRVLGHCLVRALHEGAQQEEHVTVVARPLQPGLLIVQVVVPVSAAGTAPRLLSVLLLCGQPRDRLQALARLHGRSSKRGLLPGARGAGGEEGHEAGDDVSPGGEHAHEVRHQLPSLLPVDAVQE
jgi:hypothetical protein